MTETKETDMELARPGHEKFKQKGFAIHPRDVGTLVISINGTSFSELGWATGVPGQCVSYGRWYSSDPQSPFGPPPFFSSLEYDIRDINYPGVHGTGTKSFGERGLMITASLVYVGQTKADVMSMLVTDFTNTFPQLARYDIIMPSGVANITFDGCKLVRGGASTAQWGPALNAECVATVKTIFRQYDVDSYGPNAPSP